MIKFLQKAAFRLFLLFAITASFYGHAQAFTLNHGFGTPTGVPTGIEIVSYDGESSCSTSNNGSVGTTRLVLKAKTGYTFKVTRIEGIGIRSSAGRNNFRFLVGNTNPDEPAMGPYSSINTTGCGGNDPIAPFDVPETEQSVAEGGLITIYIQRSGSTSGYSHVKRVSVIGIVQAASEVQAPVATVATNNNTGMSFTANWSAFTGATGYRLDVATDIAFTNKLEDYDDVAVAGLSHNINIGIQPSTSYYYRVRAENNAVLSANSNIIKVDVPFALPAPVATAATNSQSGIGFMANWIAVPDAIDYKIDVATDMAFTNILPDYNDKQVFSGEGVIHQVHIGLQPSTTYHYRIRARQNNLVSVNSNVITVQTPAQYALQAPVAIEATVNLTGQSFIANWAWYTGATGFRIDVATDMAFTNMLDDYNNRPVAAETISNTIMNLQHGTTYYYRVRAEYNGLTSPNSNIITVVNPASLVEPPVALAGTSVTADGFIANWQVGEMTGLVRYLFEVSASPDFSNIIGGVSVIVFNNALQASRPVTGLMPNTVYYYRVRATRGNIPNLPPQWGGEVISKYSNAIRVVTNCAAPPAPPTVQDQSVCGTTTVASLVPAPVEGRFPVTENFESAPATVNGNHTLSTGEWNFSNVQVQNTIEQSPFFGRSLRFTNLSSVTSPALNQVAAVKFFARAAGEPKKIQIAKLAAGIETVVQTITLTTQILEYTVQINDLAENIRIKFIGEENAVIAYVDDVTFSFVNGGSLAVKWYDSETATTPLSPTAVVTTGTYYVSQNVNGCESAKAPVAITTTAMPAVTPLTFCQGAAAAELTANGTGLKWYADATIANELATSHILATGTYYVTQTLNSCESARTAVAVTVKPAPAAPAISQPAQTFCAGSTVEDLLPADASIKWYTASSNGTALTADSVLTNGLSVYYASQTVDGCESTARTAVAVMVNATALPVANGTYTFCNGATVADLDATGNELQWYATETATDELAETVALATGTYYLTQTLNSCESAKVPVAVTVTNPVAAGAAVQQYNTGETLADLEVTGPGIVWYADEALTQILPATTVLTEWYTYYAVPNEGTCTGEALAVQVDDMLGNGSFDMKSLQYYPNPVKDVFTVNYSQAITSVEVYNIVGQLIINKTTDAAAVQVDMAALQAGTYIVKLQSENSSKTLKVIKQ